MIKQKLKKHIHEALKEDSTTVELYEEEIEAATKYDLLSNDVKVIQKDNGSRYNHGYVERTEKDSLALVLVETMDFLQEEITVLQKHPNEFVYIESFLFDMLGIDAISLEIDDVFQTYTALLGLQIPRKYEQALKQYLDTHLSGDEGRFSIAYSAKDQLWDINFSLSYVEGFSEHMTLQEACTLAYLFTFSMVASLEDNV